jgi:hypothetical protein
MAAKTRAKFRVHAVELMKSSATNPKYIDLYKSEGWQAAQDAAEKDGEPLSIPFDQPTVKLSAVVGAPEDKDNENAAFWSATPSGQITMTISNPDAAELFELGESYYVDFTPAA